MKTSPRPPVPPHPGHGNRRSGNPMNGWRGWLGGLALGWAVGCGQLPTQPDAGGVDAGVVDAGVVDAGVVDAGVVDAGAVDAGAVDAGVVDAGAVDAGAVDAGVVDAGVVDAGVVDAGVVDAGSACSSHAISGLQVSYWQQGTLMLRGDLGPSAHLELWLSAAHVQGAGTYALAPADGGAPCDACAYLHVGARTYAVKSGSVTLTTAAMPLSPEVVGSLSPLLLHEVDSQGRFVSSGACADTVGGVFDTTVPLGAPCTRALECADPAVKSCDPVLLQCEPACNTVQRPQCPMGTVPYRQGSWSGDTCACFPACTRFGASTCASGMSCQLAGVGTTGRCVRTGLAALGAACVPTDTSTGCADSAAVCGRGICTPQCDPLAAAPGCTATQRCSFYTYCHGPVGPEGQTPIGATCGSGLEAPCADDGVSYRGVCSSANPGDALVCRRLCRQQSDCTAGTCVAMFRGGMVCR